MTQEASGSLPPGQPFVYKSYTKQELACMYVPGRSQRTAIRTFNKWIRHSPRFWRQLQHSGVNIQTQIYNVRQVHIIVAFLGEP